LKSRRKAECPYQVICMADVLWHEVGGRIAALMLGSTAAIGSPAAA
jgi:hypothetical protein